MGIAMNNEQNRQTQWKLPPIVEPPQWFIEAVRVYTPASDGRFAAQLLWQRGIRERSQLAAFIDANYYQPASAFEFGEEMHWAVKRIETALNSGEKVAIWGDFDADGVTATSVLWEGLGEFFLQELQLVYYIPDRLKESHGLNLAGIERLANWGVKLIITCDTGSTNLTEIDYANQLGIELIITDHHTLPSQRPRVTAIINPRYLPENHPLYHLSGVAVAYKLMEAVYQTLPNIAKQPVEELLDLVAIGLIADLVQLSADGRYLAQKGINKLQNTGRSGLVKLLELCRANGDRPTDISFGIGPRINAVSRIQGDASFCVQLLTTKDKKQAELLAERAESLNNRRKSLQKYLLKSVQEKIAKIDLSTTSVIVLDDPSWSTGVLGLVAGQIAEEYGRPTILLSTASQGKESEKLARGSARSINNIDLYQLLLSQSHLLHRFGGHPFAAGLSLPLENLSLFREAINQELRQKVNIDLLKPLLEIDLIVKVADLGQNLFRELKLLEPCGMGNPAPKLLIQNCWFDNLWQTSKDVKGKPINYPKTNFNIYDGSKSDGSLSRGFPGVWWGHYKEEIPQGELLDAVVELDWNDYNRQYEVRLVAVRPASQNNLVNSNFDKKNILDYRDQKIELPWTELQVIDECPQSWQELKKQYQQAVAKGKKLALGYKNPLKSPEQIGRKLIGIAKYLSRTGQTVTKDKLKQELDLSDRLLELALATIEKLGFFHKINQEKIEMTYRELGLTEAEIQRLISGFILALAEEQFQRQYFFQVPLEEIETMLAQI
jgi:single-stranded-DNA-specific exonuclease